MSGQEPRDTSNSSLWVAVSSAELPAKKYFKIGEVAQLVGVEPHVLRYWQTQFPQVRPQKSRSGHRLYRRRDVETLLAIRELLHVQRFTIAGAKQALRGLGRNPSELPFDATAMEVEEMPTAATHSIDAFRALSEQNHVFEVESLEDESSPPLSVYGHGRTSVDGGMRDNIRPPFGTAPRPQHRGTEAYLDEESELTEIDVEGLGPHALLEAMEKQLAESYQRDMVSLPYEAQLFDEISWQKKDEDNAPAAQPNEGPIEAFSRRHEAKSAAPVLHGATSPQHTLMRDTAIDGASNGAHLTTLDPATASFVAAPASTHPGLVEEGRNAVPPTLSSVAVSHVAPEAAAALGTDVDTRTDESSGTTGPVGGTPQTVSERKSKARGEQLGFGFTPTSRATLEAAKAELQSMLSLLHQSDVESRRAFHPGSGAQRNADRTTEL